jgi:DNA polymerase-4
MQEKGFETCGDLQRLSLDEMTHLFGRWVPLSMISVEEWITGRFPFLGRESLSVWNTPTRKTSPLLKLAKKKLPSLVEELQSRISKKNLQERIQSLVVKVKFFNFKQTTLEQSQDLSLSLQSFSPMLEEAYYREAHPVRLLGLGVKLKSSKPKQKTPQLAFF